MSNVNWAWIGLIFGIMLTAASLYAFPDGGSYRGFAVPSLGVAIHLFVGVCIIVISLRAILRGEGKPRPYTDKDVEDSKRRLEQMYIKEHGELPPASRQDEQGKSEKEKNR